MAEQTGDQVRVTLRWIQILDSMDAGDTGEFKITARVTGRGGNMQETNLPETGHYSISDHPAWNKLGLDRVIYEGAVDDELTVELNGEEIDLLSANDELESYTRVFKGSPGEWVGWYGPGDEGSEDPENMSNWRICYEIERM